jgi:putative ABC transport system permease protein
MLLRSLLLTAWTGVAANKLRAVLTTLGIIIGVASVISMQALGNGARAAVEGQFRFLGANEVQISAQLAMDRGQLEAFGKVLSYEDGLLMPDEVPLVERVEMSVNGSGKLRNGRNVLDMGISGVTASDLAKQAGARGLQPVGWPEGQPLSAEAFLEAGRFFTPDEVLEGADVCVLGSTTAYDLFNGDDPIGQTVLVNRDRCEVIGVLVELETVDDEQRYQVDANNAFMMPISTVIQSLYEEEPSVFMTAIVTDESRVDEAKVQISEYLRKRHAIEADADGNYQDDFSITTRKDILGAQQEAARTFSLLLTAMAVVSLVVGGIGIMNVMLVSVTERTREIGVRLAVGARQRDIVAQFLIEAVLISAAGGLLGILVGILSIPLAASLNNGNALLAPNSIPLAFTVSLLIGVVFGLYPATRAARLDPMECLRYE